MAGGPGAGTQPGGLQGDMQAGGWQAAEGQVVPEGPSPESSTSSSPSGLPAGCRGWSQGRPGLQRAAPPPPWHHVLAEVSGRSHPREPRPLPSAGHLHGPPPPGAWPQGRTLQGSPLGMGTPPALRSFGLMAPRLRAEPAQVRTGVSSPRPGPQGLTQGVSSAQTRLHS